MDNLKPLTVDRCSHRNSCYNYHKGNCQGCNIWNYLYNSDALINWCDKQGEDIELFSMKMHHELEQEEYKKK